MSSIKPVLWMPYAVLAAYATYYIAPSESSGDIEIQDIFIKVFPVVYLVAIVESYLVDTQQFDAKKDSVTVGKKLKEKEAFTERRKLGDNVKYGLIASAIGDGFMLLNKTESYFLVGIFFFAIAQSFYIRGFGFKHRNHLIGALVYVGLVGLYYIILPAHETVLQIGIAVYGFLLCTVFWRAVDRSLYKDGRTQLQNRFLVAGSVLFVISDLTIIGFKTAAENGHITIPGQIFIFITYFCAQGSVVAGTV